MSTNNEDESMEELNEYLHNLLGYGASDDAHHHPWLDLPKATPRLGLDVVNTFLAKYGDNFLAQRWQSKISSFFDSQKNLNEEFEDMEEALGDIPVMEPLQSQPRDGPSLPPIQQIPITEPAESQPKNGPSRTPVKQIPPWQRYLHSVGGSSKTTATRRTRRSPFEQVKAQALTRAIAKVGGVEAAKEL